MIAFIFVAISFIASEDGSLARANVHVLDTNLTHEDCMTLLEQKRYAMEAEPFVYACTLPYDF